MATIQKMTTPMGVKTAGAMFHGCSDSNQPYARSRLSSSSTSVVHMLPALNPTSRYLATKHANKLPSSDLQLHLLVSAAHRAAPINALMQSSAPSAPPITSTDHDCKALLTLSEHWREIQGEKHWDGLLDHPINETLRAEIIRYGEFAQVCYDAFDFSQHSLYCGSCKYNRGALFEKVDKGSCGYEVTKYLYATSKLDLPKFFTRSERKEEPRRWSRDSNWIGYVAVCTDEDEIRRIGRRDILIAWRGTVTTTEWVDDLMLIQAPANIELAAARSSQPLQSQLYNAASSRIQNADAELARSCAHDRHLSGEDLNEVVKVETGFLSLYSSSKASSKFNKLSTGQQMAMEVKRLLQKYEGEEISISITGHSLGAALALLCAYDIAANVGGAPSDIAVPQIYTTPTVPNGVVGAAVARQGKSTISASPLSLFALLNIAAPSRHKAQLGAANSAASSCGTPWIKEAVPSVLAAATPTSACINMAASCSSIKEAAPPEVARSSPLITVYSFGGPRVGNKAFKRRLEGLGVRVLRIVNVHDCVPKVPGVLFNERSPQVWPNSSSYHHVGKELSIDFDFSPHLRKTHDLASHHNLEAHLHVLDGFHGFTRPFQSIFKRNPALVNKSSDLLQRGAFIPPYWWQDHNKGLVKDPLSGQWVLASREDDHIPEIHHPQLPQAYIG